jgi:thioredoxin-like negative regulator of GroEL
VDANEEMASEYKVSSLPTCIVFQDEQPIARYEGADLSSLSRHLSSLARGAKEEEEEDFAVGKRQVCENRQENRGGKDEEHGNGEQEKFKAKKRRKQRLEEDDCTG